VPRAVLDTNVLVSALISPGGPSAALLLELRAGAFELVASPTLLAELREVLCVQKRVQPLGARPPEGPVRTWMA
jgi:putative PIN family toxin of toxin-antitoxin system